jgi:hypothetical protein
LEIYHLKRGEDTTANSTERIPYLCSEKIANRKDNSIRTTPTDFVLLGGGLYGPTELSGTVAFF